MFKTENVTCQNHTVFQRCRELSGNTPFLVFCVCVMCACVWTCMQRPKITRLLSQTQSSPKQLVLLAGRLWAGMTGRPPCPASTRALVLTPAEQALQPSSHSQLCILVLRYNKNHDKITEESFLQFWNTAVQYKKQKNMSHPASSEVTFCCCCCFVF